MAKTLVVNTLGGKGKFVYLPTDATNAATFAAAHFDGEYAVYELEKSAGVQAPIASARSVTVSGKDTTTFKKCSFSFVSKATTTTDEIETLLKGKTFNGVKFDEVTVVKSIPLSFS